MSVSLPAWQKPEESFRGVDWVALWKLLSPQVVQVLGTTRSPTEPEWSSLKRHMDVEQFCNVFRCKSVHYTVHLKKYLVYYALSDWKPMQGCDASVMLQSLTVLMIGAATAAAVCKQIYVGSVKCAEKWCGYHQSDQHHSYRPAFGLLTDCYCGSMSFVTVG